ncbi:hypothetical protein LTR91_012100 [Friedmanniomyces endolithicus]|uniref:Heterokaryon incompatibility domain-containing protein n=1 Tax=Friedmanniomyces endolithicus TaxID=329885 RepID=A0AAN6QR16_9PEZI|nr:hypothetical protein LTR57_017839 [Friedmanniomyces endolithicus]KAK0964461.1 hypothetical protein LTS01_018829 [Friedmanniomyces endolithicus]KAK0980972.1 hypothetical protein LTR91_012100 [Friedmanniomyces endolithicus]KAK1083569.1 hypothetical protein LTR33_003180 [Friedmanniomyces endolithicus]
MLRPAEHLKDPLFGDLMHASFLDSPLVQYETISYCWGSSRIRSTLVIQGHVVDVPASSAKALRRVRLRNKSRLVWIDAICINQNDSAEKSAQVAMMADIFRSGVGGVIYLGEETRDSARIGKALDLSHSENGCTMHGCEGVGEVTHGFSMTDRHLKALSDFYTRDWFSREELPTLLVPDYEKPARNVHRDAARYLLELPGSSSGLRTLQEVHHTEEPATSTAARPSWVPFWVHQDSGSGWSAPDLVATFQRYTAHSAHNDTMVDIRPAMLEDLDVLELSGLFIDTIVDASEIFQYEDLAEDDNGVKVRQLVDRVVELLGVDHKCPDALWEVAVFLFAGTPEWSKEQTLQNFHYYLLYLMERQRQPPNPDGPTANAQFGARKASEFMRALAAVWPGCRLFSTSNGRVGFARAVIQPGDELIIFYGGRVPFVLRSAGEYHQLLSQAHVHGIMKGEAMRHHQTEGTPSQLFRLR